jgi:hypothetical protein
MAGHDSGRIRSSAERECLPIDERGAATGGLERLGAGSARLGAGWRG